MDSVLPLYDTHCHLQAQRLQKDWPAVFERAKKAGIAGVLCCATGTDDWGQVLELSQLHPEIHPAFGVHPWYQGQVGPETWLQTLKNLLLTNPLAWVGEIGIDRTMGPPLQEQEKVFMAQLSLADELERPISLHCRKTWDRLIFLLQKFPKVSVVIHSFSASIPVAELLLKRGNVYFSFSGNITKPRNQRLPEVLRFLPKELILMETDSPDLLPDPLVRVVSKGSLPPPNEPANIHYVLQAMALAMDWSLEKTAHQLEKNTRGLLGFEGPSDIEPIA